MATDCCNLVGNFTVPGFLSDNCIISINSDINSESSDFGCSELKEGYRVGSLNVSAYANTEVYSGCKGRAGVQVLWIRKYDCVNNKLHFIFSGEGRSFKTSSLNIGSISLNKGFSTATKMVNASAQSGPGSLYTLAEQDEGIGMNYIGDPIAFNTSSDTDCKVSDEDREYYLQNFNIEFIPGAIPVANYTFAFSIEDN